MNLTTIDIEEWAHAYMMFMKKFQQEEDDWQSGKLYDNGTSRSSNSSSFLAGDMHHIMVIRFK